MRPIAQSKGLSVSFGYPLTTKLSLNTICTLGPVFCLFTHVSSKSFFCNIASPRSHFSLRAFSFPPDLSCNDATHILSMSSSGDRFPAPMLSPRCPIHIPHPRERSISQSASRGHLFPLPYHLPSHLATDCGWARALYITR